jgi:hypothetical protein
LPTVLVPVNAVRSPFVPDTLLVFRTPVVHTTVPSLFTVATAFGLEHVPVTLCCTFDVHVTVPSLLTTVTALGAVHVPVTRFWMFDVLTPRLLETVPLPDSVLSCETLVSPPVVSCPPSPCFIPAGAAGS